MYLHVKVSATQEIGERGSNTSRLVVCDQMRSEGHEEPGFALTALFTVMRSSVNYLKLERVFMSRSKPLNDTHRHTHTHSHSLVFDVQTESKTKPANTYCTIYSVDA